MQAGRWPYRVVCAQRVAADWAVVHEGVPQKRPITEETPESNAFCMCIVM